MDMKVSSYSPVCNGALGKGLIETAEIPLGPLSVVVESEAPGLVPSLLRMYSGAVTPGTPDSATSEHRTIYRIAREVDYPGTWHTYTVARDGEVQYQNYPEANLFSCLEWDISGVASRSLTGYHRIHAGAVVYNGHGILLPGASGAGKSTTVAALALDGFACCSDEYALVGPDARLYPFPKIISLKTGGWQQIARDFPDEVALLGWPDVYEGGIRHVKASVVPDEQQSLAGYPIDFVVMPSYRPDRETALKPVPRSRGLKELVEQSLDLQLRGNEGLEMLVELVRKAACYSLSISSLKEASGLVKALAF